MTDSALPPDVAALLDGLTRDEASDLTEVWSLVGDPPPGDPSWMRIYLRYLPSFSKHIQPSDWSRSCVC